MYLSNGTGGTVAAMMMRILMSNDIDSFASCFGDHADVYADLKAYIDDPSVAIAEINANPDTYGNIRSDITDENAVYLAGINNITSSMNAVEIMDAYEAVCGVSGEKIGYIMADASMLPLQYGDGSSFSTIAYFGDYAVDGYGASSTPTTRTTDTPSTPAPCTTHSCGGP